MASPKDTSPKEGANADGAEQDDAEREEGVAESDCYDRKREKERKNGVKSS